MPLIFLGRTYGEWSSVLGSFELPKIVLLRLLVGLMAALWLFEWGLRSRLPVATIPDATPNERIWILQPRLWLPELQRWLKEEPTRWLTLAVLAFLGTTLLSTAFSASISVSLWGDVPGQDSYSTFTTVSYILLFGIIATHLKTPAQLWRLLGAFVLVGVLISGYSILQNYGRDFLDLLEPASATRSSATTSNPILAASVMLMTIMVSLIAATMALRESIKTARFWWKLAFWGVILAIQVLGIMFTVARGPWIGTFVGVALFLGAVGLFIDWRTLARAVLMVVVAIAFAAILNTVFSPVVASSERYAGQTQSTDDPITTSEVIEERLTGISNLGGTSGFGNRIHIWKGSWRLVTQHPWFGFDSLIAGPLRPLVGYGPELFRTAYLLESPAIGEGNRPLEMAHAHNYFVHQGVEQGILGGLASVGITAALLLVGAYLILRHRRRLTLVHKVVLIGLLATIAGRTLEQMVGIARISDLTLTWVLLGVFAALPLIMQSDGETAVEAPRRNRRRRSNRRPSGSGTLDYYQPWRFLGRMTLVVFLVTGIGVLTWSKGINYIQAAMIADRAATEFKDGQMQSAYMSLNEAIEKAPDVSTYYDFQVSVHQANRNNDPLALHPECRSESTLERQRVCLAEEEYQDTERWVENRPFAFRSRLSQANAAMQLATLTKDGFLGRESIRLFKETAEMVPNSFGGWSRAAAAHIVFGQPAEALAVIDKALAIVGDQQESASLLLLKSEAYHSLGRSQQEMATLNAAIQRFPDLAEAYYLRGLIYREEKQYEKSFENFDQAIRFNGNDAQYWYARAVTYFETGRHEEAIADLDQVVSLNPLHASAYNNRGLVNLELGRPEAAVEDFSIAIGLNPTMATAYNNRGSVYQQLGNPDKALEDLAQAIRLDPRNGQAYYKRALAHAQLGRDSDAQQDADRAEQLGIDRATLSAAIDDAKKSR